MRPWLKQNVSWSTQKSPVVKKGFLTFLQVFPTYAPPPETGKGFKLVFLPPRGKVKGSFLGDLCTKREAYASFVVEKGRW